MSASPHVDGRKPIRPAAHGDPAGGGATRALTAERPDRAGPRPGRERRRWWPDAGVALVFAAAALALTARGWAGHNGHLLGDHPLDQSFNEWMLGRAADATRHLDNPFFSYLQNAPDGVNLVTNVGLLLPAYVLVPLTLAAGPAVSYLLLITVNLAGTAFAWYWVLSRHLVRTRAAAFVGGLFCGFAPAMISESAGHPHITAQWLVPFLVWQVVRLATPGPAVRRGLALGGLVVLQFFLGLEVLLLTAVAGTIAAVAYLVLRPRAAREALPSALRSLAVTAGVVLAVTGYPIWFMFLGPQGRIGHPPLKPDQLALTLDAFVAFPSRALAGAPGSSVGLAPNTAEETAFFGWPLVVLAVLAAGWMIRRVEVRVLAVTAVVAGSFAVGTTWAWAGRRSSVPAPFAVVDGIPPFDAIVPARFALITTAALGVLLALAADRVLTAARPADPADPAGPATEAEPAGPAADGAPAPPAADREPAPPATDGQPAGPAAVGGPGVRTVRSGARRAGWAGAPAVRVVAGLALVAALVPIVPAGPLGTTARPPTPHFITSGEWRNYVGQGRTLVPVPLDSPHAIRWGPAADFGFAVPLGYFIGPTSATDRQGFWGARRRPTTVTLGLVTSGKHPGAATATERRRAVADARFWRADAVVLESGPREDALRGWLDDCFGPGRRVDDVWVWDVRSLTR